MHRRIRRQLENGQPFEIVYLRLGDMLVELNRRGDPGAEVHTGAGNKPFGLAVDDIRATVEELRSKGVEITLEPREANTFGGLLAAFKDPEGHEIEIKEYRGDGQLDPDWQPSRPGVVRIA